MFKRYFVISDRPKVLNQEIEPQFSYQSEYPENHDEGFSILEEAKTFRDALSSTLKTIYPNNPITVKIWDNVAKKLIN